MSRVGKPVKIRKVWAIKPCSRVKISKKIYSRKILKRELERIAESEE